MTTDSEHLLLISVEMDPVERRVYNYEEEAWQWRTKGSAPLRERVDARAQPQYIPELH